MTYTTSQSFSFRAMLRQVEQAHADQLAVIDTLAEALKGLLAEVDATAARCGWSGHGARDAARHTLSLVGIKQEPNS